MKNNPGIAKMVRAKFLSSIISPVLAGTLLSVYISGSFSFINFLLVFLGGIGLHVATNVYNDIYDTIQGTDKVNVHRNEASGGSGVLLDQPELMGKMYFLARTGLVLAALATLGLTFRINPGFWPLLWGLFFLSAFFSKFYTAAPVKLSYRGWGEVSVWFAFGPMAILYASLGQGVGLHPMVLLLMPATGLSTSSILLAGQLIDLDADRKGGKHGVASRMGTRFTSFLYLAVQLGIVLNVVLMFFFFAEISWPILLALLPYVLIFPKAASFILKHHSEPQQVKTGAKYTVLTHIVFSLLLSIGLGLYLILNL